MSDPTVTLRLEAENRRLLPPVRQARAEVAELGKAAAEGGQRGAAGIDKLADSASGAEQDVSRLGTSAKQAFGAVAALASVRVAQQLGAAFLSAADRAGQLEARMRLATNGQDEYNYAMQRSEAIAHSSYQSINLVADIAVRASGPMQQLGYTVRDTLDLTEALSLSLVASAANQQQSAATIDQFSKAMQTGTLRGQEFQTVLQNAPRFVTALEDSLGKTRAELISMADAGELSIGTLTGVASQLGKLRDDVELLPTTLEDAMVRFANTWQAFAGAVNESIQVNGSLVSVIDTVSEHMGTLAMAAGLVAVAFTSRMAVAIVEATAAKVRDIATTRLQAQTELQAARTAEAAAAARVAAARAGMGAAGSLAASEAQLAAAQARTAAATHAASFALQAKAAAARAAGAALALFGGPVGLAVTALTLFVLWARNSAQEADRLGESVSTGFQSAIGTFQAFNRETANESFAGLADARKKVDKAVEAIATLEAREAQLEQQRRDALVRSGRASQATIDQLGELRTVLESARLHQQQLSAEQERAINVAADLVLETAGITNANEAEKKSLQEKLVELSKNEQTMQQSIPHLVRWAESMGRVEAANRLGAASFRELADATKIDWADIDKALDQQAASAQRRYVELTQGRAAARRMDLEAMIPGGEDPQQADWRRAQIEWILKTEAAADAVAESTRGVSTAETSAKRAADELTRTREQQAESQARYANEAAMAAAQLQGPIKEAEEQRAQRIAALDAELAKLNITQAAHTTLVDAANAAEARRTAELRQQQQAPRALIDAMTGELQLLSQLGDVREIHTRQLQAEDDMRRAIADSIAADNTALRDSPDEQARLIDQARAMAAYSLEIEDNTYRLEEWANVATRGVAGVADVFADLFSRQIRSSKEFVRSLKDVFTQGFRDIMRTLLEQEMVRPFQRAVLGMLSGQGFAGAGQPMNNYAAALAEGVTGQVVNGVSGAIVNGVSQGMSSYFGGSAATAGTAAAGARQMVMVNGQLVEVVSEAGGGFGSTGGLLNAKMLTGEFAGGMPYASAALGLMGLFYGATRAGSGGLSSAVGAASYGALGVAAGGAIAGGLGAVGAGVGASGVAAGAASGATGAMAGLGSAAWIPVVGWTLAAIGAVDLVTGGKLLGTRFGAKEVNTELSINNAGGSASAEVYEERKRSLFRGTARRWRGVEASDEATEAAAVLYRAIEGVARTAANQIGVDMTNLVAGTFKATYDTQGNVKSEVSTVLGRTYSEGIEEFQKRLSAENIIAQVTVLDRTASVVAERWRQNADTLLEGAQFMLAAATDVANGLDLWSAQGLGALTTVLERMQAGDESLAQTYQRMSSTAMEYGEFVAGIDSSIRTAGLNEFQRAALDVEMQYRDQVRTANDLAKALGLSGARAEDLAKIEQLRALGMAQLQAQIEAERNRALDDVTLSQYSPLNDQQKLGEAMQQLTAAATAGDLDRARSLSDTALGLGRNLFASGTDYNSLYEQVRGVLGSVGDGLDLDMDDGTSMGDLADILTALPQQIASALFEQVYNPATPTNPNPDTPTTPTTSQIGGNRAEDLLQGIYDLQRRQMSNRELEMLR